MAISFKGAHFPTEVILMGVRWYVLVPAEAGASLLLLVALVVHNLAPHRRYPAYWW